MATHSSILAWKMPWTEEPGGPQYMGSQRVGHDLVTQPTKMQGILLFKKLRFASGQHLTKCYALLSTGLRMIVHA